ncbi:hypothetical protein U9M48_035358, partial [Paspalum notatum var. saurae]
QVVGFHVAPNSGELPQILNKTYIVLIPKGINANSPQNFRPISLCNVNCKIISSTIAKRIKNHLPSYIHASQAAFIPGRHITSNIILAQEITHSFSLKNWNHHAFMLKIDLAKAFDRIEWAFILRALQRRGVSNHFCRLVHQCLSTTSFSVIINSQPFHDFRDQRGIRQGCPLSPYLFVLAINELSLSLQQAMDGEAIKGFSLGPNCPPIHSLMFVDDLIVRGQTTKQEIDAIKQIIDTFCSASGQTPNRAKSSITYSKNVTQQEMLMFESCRKIYINSVLCFHSLYYMTNILFPKNFLEKITSHIRNFWWKGNQLEGENKTICFRAW